MTRRRWVFGPVDVTLELFRPVGSLCDEHVFYVRRFGRVLFRLEREDFYA